MTQGQFFKQSTAGLNSGFSFFLPIEPRLPYYLHLGGMRERRDGFMAFLWAFEWSEMQTHMTWIWTCKMLSIIMFIYGNVFMCLWVCVCVCEIERERVEEHSYAHIQVYMSICERERERERAGEYRYAYIQVYMSICERERERESIAMHIYKCTWVFVKERERERESRRE